LPSGHGKPDTAWTAGLGSACGVNSDGSRRPRISTEVIHRPPTFHVKHRCGTRSGAGYGALNSGYASASGQLRSATGRLTLWKTLRVPATGGCVCSSSPAFPPVTVDHGLTSNGSPGQGNEPPPTRFHVAQLPECRARRGRVEAVASAETSSRICRLYRVPVHVGRSRRFVQGNGC
jgi:hypothetical protein